jgi:hypothetical protein
MQSPTDGPVTPFSNLTDATAISASSFSRKQEKFCFDIRCKLSEKDRELLHDFQSHLVNYNNIKRLLLFGDPKHLKTAAREANKIPFLEIKCLEESAASDSQLDNVDEAESTNTEDDISSEISQRKSALMKPVEVKFDEVA